MSASSVYSGRVTSLQQVIRVSTCSASVKARLMNVALKRGEVLNLVVVRYGIERLLFRLTQSAYADRFLLKGAMLFVLWDEKTHRPTHDLDLLGFGYSEKDDLARTFREIAVVPVADVDLSLIRPPLRRRRSGRTPSTEVFASSFWQGSAQQRFQSRSMWALAMRSLHHRKSRSSPHCLISLRRGCVRTQSIRSWLKSSRPWLSWGPGTPA